MLIVTLRKARDNPNGDELRIGTESGEEILVRYLEPAHGRHQVRIGIVAGKTTSVRRRKVDHERTE